MRRKKSLIASQGAFDKHLAEHADYVAANQCYLAACAIHAEFLEKCTREENRMENRQTVEAILNAGTALAYATISHNPTRLIDAVENWQAVAIRPRTKSHKEVRAANVEFITLCNTMVRNALARVGAYCEVVRKKPNGK